MVEMSRINPEIYQRVQRRVLHSDENRIIGSQVSGAVKVSLMDPTDFYLKCGEEDFLSLAVANRNGSSYYSLFWDTQISLSDFHQHSLEFYEDVLIDHTIEKVIKPLKNDVLFTGNGEPTFISLDDYFLKKSNFDPDFDKGVLRLFTPCFDLGFERIPGYQHTKISVVSHQDLSSPVTKLIKGTSRFGFIEDEKEELEKAVTFLMYDKFLKQKN